MSYPIDTVTQIIEQAYRYNVTHPLIPGEQGTTTIIYIPYTGRLTQKKQAQIFADLCCYCQHMGIHRTNTTDWKTKNVRIKRVPGRTETTYREDGGSGSCERVYVCAFGFSNANR